MCFSDVFRKEILGLPPMREIDFIIELVLETALIFKAPYHMASAKLRELKLSCRICWTRVSYDPAYHHGEHQYYLSRKRMDP